MTKLYQVKPKFNDVRKEKINETESPKQLQARENLIYSSTSQQRTNKWYWDN